MNLAHCVSLVKGTPLLRNITMSQGGFDYFFNYCPKAPDSNNVVKVASECGNGR